MVKVANFMLYMYFYHSQQRNPAGNNTCPSCSHPMGENWCLGYVMAQGVWGVESLAEQPLSSKDSTLWKEEHKYFANSNYCDIKDYIKKQFFLVCMYFAR